MVVHSFSWFEHGGRDGYHEAHRVHGIGNRVGELPQRSTRFAGDKHDKHIADGSKILITSPKDGDKVGDSFELKFELSKGSHGGHAHVFVEIEYQRGFQGTIKGLSKGAHQITVKAADKDHASVAATHTITVDVQ